MALHGLWEQILVKMLAHMLARQPSTWLQQEWPADETRKKRTSTAAMLDFYRS